MTLTVKDLLANRWVRVETAMLVLAIGIAVYAFMSSRQAASVAESVTLAERRLSSAQKKLSDLRSGEQATKLREELAKLEGSPPASLPSLGSALELGSQISEYAATQRLVVKAFEVAPSSYESGGARYPAIAYTVTAQGAPEALAGILRLAVQLQTAEVHVLDFSRTEGGGDWTLLLNLIVAHSGR